MSSSAERCARKIAQHETPLVVGHFTSDGDSAASIGFERGQQTHCTVYVENLRE
jgi:single-stranded DNA-specific DHH superfamily exonuclease